MVIMEERDQTRDEELANGISHLLGVFFCVIAMPFLIIIAYENHDFVKVFSVLTYGFGMLMVYTFSTLYHLVYKEKAKRILNIADHVSIYFLIAGTYTPLMVVYLNQSNALIFLGIVWLLVIIGTFLKIFFMNRFKVFSLALYLIMGWMIIFVIKPLWGAMPLDIFLWILAGGLFYTIGVYFFVKGYIKGYHTIWHFCVLLGTVFHYVAIYKSL